MKKIRKINSAEGIFLLCFDSIINDMNEYTTENCTAQQIWDSIKINSKNDNFKITWHGEVNTKSYDRLLVDMQIPQYISVNVSATVNGERKTIIKDRKGAPIPCEPTGFVGENAHITDIEIEFTSGGSSFEEHNITLYWMGVQSSDREHLIEEELPRYTKDSWEDYINYDIKPTADKNIFFTQEQMEGIKAKVNTAQYKELAEEIYASAKSVYPDDDPEKEIRGYVPVQIGSYRHNRERDRYRKEINELEITTLAIGGYFLDKPEWTNMAARMIMCIVKTPHWFEGPQCHVEGSTWHHVCFLESDLTVAISVALGFMGGVFTQKAIDEIMTAMKKHYKTILKCCAENGYRRFMNQGIVENAARMVGACCFSLFGDKSYDSQIDACYTEHTEIMGNYLNDEGHCTEGYAYYQYSLRESIKLWCAYAKVKNTDLKSVVPKMVENSIKYIECCLSSATDVGTVIPLNDTEVPKHSSIFDQMLNFFVAIWDWNEGKMLISNRKKSSYRSGSSLVGELILMSLEENINLDYKEEKKPKYHIFEESGLAAFEHDDGKFWFCAERNPLTGHYHCDRGSIVLEEGGKILLPDIGKTDYANILCVYMKNEDFHSLTHPDGIPMHPASQIGVDSANEAGVGCKTVVSMADFREPQSKINYMRKIENGLEFSADMENLYDERVLMARREGKLERKDTTELSLCDSWEFTEDSSVYVNFISYYPWVIEKNSAYCNADGVRLTLSFEYENNFELMTDDFMKITDTVTAHRLRLKTTSAKTHKILTKGRVENNGI